MTSAARRTAAIAAAIAAIGFSSAFAERDRFGLGDGHHGARVVSTPNVQVNPSTVVSGPPGPSSVPVSTTAGFSPGDLVLLLQPTGLPGATTGNTQPIDLSHSDVGQWELARISGLDAGVLMLSAPLVQRFSPWATQAVLLPEYTDVTIGVGASLVAPRWDGTSGGVVGFLASGTVTNAGTISASAAGFRGGLLIDQPGRTGCMGLDEPWPNGALKGEGIVYTRYGLSTTGYGNLANAGGGGVCLNSGGGGGGNGGPGGRGGRSAGVADRPIARDIGGFGGAPVRGSLLDQLFFGGGGGAGDANSGSGSSGGAGGGLVFLRAGQLAGAGILRADGETAGDVTNDAAGGGGAGGTVYLRVSGTAECGAISARGGDGGSSNYPPEPHGPGGGGGGGQVLFQAAPGGSCPISVASGLGGTSADAGSYGLNYGSGPNAASASTFAGVVQLLDAGLRLPAVELTAPAANTETEEARPTLQGTATPGSTVLILLDGAEWATVTASASGDFSFTPTADLSVGTHQLQVVAELDRSWTAPSAPLALTVRAHPLDVGCGCQAGGGFAWAAVAALVLAALGVRRSAAR